MIVAKSRVILRFYHAMHAGDGDVSPAAAVRCVEKDFARAILTGDTNSHTEDVDCRCGHPRLFAGIPRHLRFQERPVEYRSENCWPRNFRFQSPFSAMLLHCVRPIPHRAAAKKRSVARACAATAPPALPFAGAIPRTKFARARRADPPKRARRNFPSARKAD